MITRTISQASKSALGFGVGDAIGAGLNAYGAYQEFKGSRAKGDSLPVSVAKGGIDMALGEVFGPYYLGYIGVTSAVKGAYMLGEVTAKEMDKGYNHRGKFGSGYVHTTQAGYTMRQRSLNAMRENGMNIASVFGNEARTYFRSAGY